MEYHLCTSTISSNLIPFSFHLKNKSCLQDAIEYFWNRVSDEELQVLLTDDEAWETFVVEADWSRGEADALRAVLKELNIDTAMEDKDVIQKDQLDIKEFLNEFPRVKWELEERIGKLHALANKVDKVHRDCTISNVVAASTGAVSGILTILGLALAPVTAGVSLALSATGIGLGVAADVTSVSTRIVERSSNLSAKAEASRLALIDIDKGEMVKKTLCHSELHIFALSKNFIQVVKNIKKVHAIKLATAKPHLADDAKRLMTIGRISVHRGKQVRKAFGGTALAMTKGARIMGAATAGVFLLMDVVKLVKQSVHLHEGTKAESAEELRQQAQELERVLEELTQIYEMLQ
ncbi:hypothetical protein HPG69_009805 [Diceros bicornis minor]|uniref:Apolipoprotein L3-like n=1 Tax=Diceros bicornis minor TaxID=77932 RepID=A0A7J7EWI2_DICBM|nr:hypothetical protein HPG69_009805 [Diceros bicornis minor]